MPNRIDAAFSKLRETNQTAFVAYVAAGDPDFDASLETIKALADAGADIIELGLPFSDPLADGIVNQMAAERALKSGMTTARCIELIRRFRETHETPIVLFTYLNPIFTYGFENFHHDAAAAGADGILLLDLPPDEAALNTDLSHPPHRTNHSSGTRENPRRVRGGIHLRTFPHRGHRCPRRAFGKYR
jgi:tryptophan synthase alpha chain